MCPGNLIQIQLPLLDRLTILIIETDSDPNYQRISAELCQELQLLQKPT